MSRLVNQSSQYPGFDDMEPGGYCRDAQREPDLRPTYYCEWCDEHYFADEVFPAFDPSTRKDGMAHEGPEVSVGGDGYGGRCCGTMDAPTIHIVTEVTGRSRFDLFNQVADRLEAGDV